jgi:hypothetical protein
MVAARIPIMELQMALKEAEINSPNTPTRNVRDYLKL